MAGCLGPGWTRCRWRARVLTGFGIDAADFDDLFGGAVRVNSEGMTIFGEDGRDSGNGIEFSERNVKRLLEREPMAAPGEACLALAWRSRMALLAQ